MAKTLLSYCNDAAKSMVLPSHGKTLLFNISMATVEQILFWLKLLLKNQQKYTSATVAPLLQKMQFIILCLNKPTQVHIKHKFLQKTPIYTKATIISVQMVQKVVGEST